LGKCGEAAQAVAVSFGNSNSTRTMKLLVRALRAANPALAYAPGRATHDMSLSYTLKA